MQCDTDSELSVRFATAAGTGIGSVRNPPSRPVWSIGRLHAIYRSISSFLFFLFQNSFVQHQVSIAPPSPPYLSGVWTGQPPSGRDFRLQESKDPPLIQFASEVVPLWPRDIAVMQSNARGRRSIIDVRSAVGISSRGRLRDLGPIVISILHCAPPGLVYLSCMHALRDLYGTLGTVATAMEYAPFCTVQYRTIDKSITYGTLYRLTRRVRPRHARSVHWLQIPSRALL